MWLLGIPFHRMGSKKIKDAIQQTIESNEKAIFLNLNIHGMVKALEHPWMHNFLRQAHIVFCDGDGVRWGLRILRHKPPPKIPTTRWIWPLCAFAGNHGYRMYFLGGAPGVADAAMARLKQSIPKLQVVGTHHGQFIKDGEENDRILEEINQLKPDILMVCMGMPTQEKWIMDNWQNLDVHVFLKGGAVFDYVSDKLGKAPKWMIRANLEWLFRISEEPGRLLGRYLWDIPFFFVNVLIEKAARILFRADPKEYHRHRP